ncbi:MAG: two-component sensor histidine kinase, partial [Albidovulum sp.]
MISSTIKRILPRGLYGRAALILIVPILALQLVVSLAFLQRHFEGVTRQMTRNIALEIALISDAVAAAPDPAGAAAPAARLGEA